MNGSRTLPINAAGLALIKSFESCKLTAYQDQKGIWTCGWGETAGVTATTTMTQEEADAKLTGYLTIVSLALTHWLPETLNDNQFSACVSLAYNIGIGRFKGSTLLKCLLANDLAGASAQFLVWMKIDGLPNAGLLRRRKAEQALFNT